MAIDCELVQAAKAWPFQEARNVIDRLGGADASHTPEKGYVLFETGYGPSGLPHIGTFGEVARTSFDCILCTHRMWRAVSAQRASSLEQGAGVVALTQIFPSQKKPAQIATV